MAKPNFRQAVAEEMIRHIEAGTAPWQKPWTPGVIRSAPFNPLTDRNYRGINAWWLDLQGHADPRWMTYRQAQKADAAVRKGERGTQVEYWKWTDRVPMTDEDGKPILGEDGKPRMREVRLDRPRVFHAVVFNAEQIDGLAPFQAPEPTFEPVQEAEKILAAGKVPIHHDQGDRAFYVPARDEIHLPPQAAFKSAYDYYATALHELGHATGHESRLGRTFGPRGSDDYAKEELRAEMAAFMVSTELGLGHYPERHASYVEFWLKALKEDHNLLFAAARDAEKIRTWVMEPELRPTLVQTRPQAQEATQSAALPSLGGAIARIANDALEIETDQAIEIFGGLTPLVDYAAEKGMTAADLGTALRLAGEAAPPRPRDALELARDRLQETDLVLDGPPAPGQYTGPIVHVEDRYAVQKIGQHLVAHDLAGLDFDAVSIARLVDARRMGQAATIEQAGDGAVRLVGVAPSMAEAAAAAIDATHADRLEGADVGDDPVSMWEEAVDRQVAAFNGVFNKPSDSYVFTDGTRYILNDGANEPPVGSRAHQVVSALADTLAEVDGQGMDAIRALREAEHEVCATHGGIFEKGEPAFVFPDGSRFLTERGEVERSPLQAWLAEQARSGLSLGMEPSGAESVDAERALGEDALARVPEGDRPMLRHRFGQLEALTEATVTAAIAETNWMVLAAERTQAPEGAALSEMFSAVGRHDWNWDYADDPNTRRRGRAEQERILSGMADLAGRSELNRDLLSVMMHHHPLIPDHLRDRPAWVRPMDQLQHDVVRAFARDPEKELVQSADQVVTAKTAVYLDVPFAEKNQAKAAGARWDPERKAWYAPEGADVAALSKWSPDQKAAAKAPQARQEEKTMGDRTDRIYLAVPYAEKDAAKALGAKWDRRRKSWYAPEGVDTAPLAKWVPDAQAAKAPVAEPPSAEAEFAEALRANGLVLEGAPMMDGRWHRVPVEDDAKGKISGSYRGFLDGRPAGQIMNYKTGDKAVQWVATGNPLDPAERDRLKAEAAARKADHDREMRERHQAVAKRAYGIWANAATAPADHPYLKAKGVEGKELRVDDKGNLLVSMHDGKGYIWNLQVIQPDGTKRFLKEGRKTGLMHVIDGEKTGPMLLAEGFATASTLNRASRQPVAVAFDAGNLEPVARSLADRGRPLVIAADDDHAVKKGNAGLIKANAAARAVGAGIIVPPFTRSEKAAGLTDWNDLEKSRGPVPLKGILKEALEQSTTAKTLAPSDRPQQAMAV